jgi:FkbM family methyltransferase
MFVPLARVISFEPNPELADRITHRFAPDGHVSVVPLGLSDSAGELRLIVPAYNGWSFDGLASFEPEDGREWLSNHLWRFDGARYSEKEISCRTAPLDDFGLDPVFVKLDVQGHEHRALLGARETIARSRPVLLIEAPGPEVNELLASLDYDPWHLSAGELKRGWGRKNSFFLHRGSCPHR